MGASPSVATKTLGYKFSKGDETKAPGCGTCWCCKPNGGKVNTFSGIIIIYGGCNRFPIFRYWPFFIPIIRYFSFFIPIIRYSHTFRYPIFRKFDDDNDFYYRYSDICDFFLPIFKSYSLYQRGRFGNGGRRFSL